MDCLVPYCQRTTFDASSDFLLACDPRLERIPSAVSSLLETLKSGESSDVPCLEWLATVGFVRTAQEDPVRRAALIRIVQRNSLVEFKPLIFGRTSLVSEFILEHTPFVPGITVRMEIQRRRLTVLAHFTTMCYHYEEVPVQKIYELSRASFRRPFGFFTVAIDVDVPGVQNIEAEIVRNKGEICPGREFHTRLSDERCRFLVFR